MQIYREKKMAKKIIYLLNMKGFIAKQHYSKTSRSIYIKIDNGIIPTIRISDHKRYNSDNCKFNLIKKSPIPQTEIINGKVKKYYTYKQINKMIRDIEYEKERKIATMGNSMYKKILKKAKQHNCKKVA